MLANCHKIYFHWECKTHADELYIFINKKHC